jgi:hypothetical protein
MAYFCGGGPPRREMAGRQRPGDRARSTGRPAPWRRLTGPWGLATGFRAGPGPARGVKLPIRSRAGPVGVSNLATWHGICYYIARASARARATMGQSPAHGGQSQAASPMSHRARCISHARLGLATSRLEASSQSQVRWWQDVRRAQARDAREWQDPCQLACWRRSTGDWRLVTSGWHASCRGRARAIFSWSLA